MCTNNTADGCSVPLQGFLFNIIILTEKNPDILKPKKLVKKGR